MRNTKYKQCELVYGIPDSPMTTQVAWIPETLAHEGVTVVLKEHPGIFWQVRAVYQDSITETYLAERERDHLHQRKASDV